MYPKNYPTKPNFLWKRFFDFTQLPRPSHKEEKAKDYLKNLAREKKLDFKEDKAGNIVIYVPASKDSNVTEPIIIQNHIDMVCDNSPSKKINFEKDPITVIVKGNILTADGTTLGADNGIGCAAALAILDEELSHPPLELLFTVEEETGLLGAMNLDPELLSGKKMINLDAEDFGSFYIGCAGGEDFDLDRELPMLKEQLFFIKIGILGLVGGHSGMDIHRNRGNAIKILNECLLELNLKGVDFKISQLSAGKAKNIIPRDSNAVIGIRKSDITQVEKIIEIKFEGILARLPEEESNFNIDIEHIGIETFNVLTKEWTERILDLLSHLPHGAFDYIWESKEPLAKYSSNLAVVHLKDGMFYALVSLRFTEETDTEGLIQGIQSLSKRYKFKLSRREGYPGWKPDYNSKLLKQAVSLFKEKFDLAPEVAAIHAGLECGVLKAKMGKVDCISFGPNISGAHSPDELVEIDSVEMFWSFLVDYLKLLSK